MLKRVFLLGVAVCMVGCAFGKGWRGENNIVAGSDKEYLWSHDLSDKSIVEGKDIEIHVSDGNRKVIKPDGTFSVNGELLATDGMWLNKKKFAVYVSKWKGWWVGKLLFNGKDNLRGMNTMFIKQKEKSIEAPNEVHKQQPKHFEKGNLYFKQLYTRQEMNMKINNGDDTMDDASCDSQSNNKNNKKHRKHGKDGKHGKGGKGGKGGKWDGRKKGNKENKGSEWSMWDEFEKWHEEAHGRHGHGHHHDHHHHGHGCCKLFGIFVMLILGAVFVACSFKFLFGDLCESGCLISMIKMKLDIENGDFRITWKKTNEENESNKNNKKEEMSQDNKKKDKKKLKKRGKADSKKKEKKEKRKVKFENEVTSEDCDNIIVNDKNDDANENESDDMDLVEAEPMMQTNDKPDGEMESQE